jgi:hypothetical protein
VLGLDAEAARGACGAIDVGAQLLVRDGAPRVAKGDTRAPPLGEVAIHEEGGGIEASGQVHDR